MGGEEREREEGEGKEGGKEGEREAKKGSGGAKEGGGCEERRREGKGEGKGKPIPTNLNAYPKRVTVEWSHNMLGAHHSSLVLSRQLHPLCSAVESQ